MLQLKDISFSYSQAKILQDITIELKQGACAAIIGESGCGKSTLLNLIYGLLQEECGIISFNGEQLDGADHHLVPGHPMMKYVPQEFNLMPFTTVFENVGEHLSIQLDNRSQRIIELLDIVDMSDYKDRKVKTLSGGQKQRVAIAKALAQQPQLLLLDEPFSNIDNFRKNDLRRSLFGYLKKEKISCLIATHDKEDVLSFTDQIIIMKNGKIIDNRITTAVYNQPLNKYTASLFDDVNVLPGQWLGRQEDLILYPYQLVVSDKGIEVIVKQCYFTGQDYVIISTKENHNIIFKSSHFIDSNESVLVDLASTIQESD